jgi:hypothetical protein
MNQVYLVNFYSEEERKKMFVPASQLKPKLKVKVDVVAEKPAVSVDVCEFVRNFVVSGSGARYCVDGVSCSVRIYGVAKVFVGCPTRLEKLKDKERT